MPDLIAPHGGELTDRTVPAAEADAFRRKAATLPKVPVSDADLSSLYRFGDGGLSPLTGPMTRDVYDRVLDEEVILHNGKKYAWTIPISFPVDKNLAASLKTACSTAPAMATSIAIRTSAMTRRRETSSSGSTATP